MQSLTIRRSSANDDEDAGLRRWCWWKLHYRWCSWNKWWWRWSVRVREASDNLESQRSWIRGDEVLWWKLVHPKGTELHEWWWRWARSRRTGDAQVDCLRSRERDDRGDDDDGQAKKGEKWGAQLIVEMMTAKGRKGSLAKGKENRARREGWASGKEEENGA